MHSIVHFSRWIAAILVYPLTVTMLVVFNPHDLATSQKWLHGISGFLGVAFVLYWAVYFCVCRTVHSVGAARD